MTSGSFSVLPALLGAGAGALAGWGLRVLVGRVPRGADVPLLPMLLSGALVTAAGVGLASHRPTLGLVVWAGWLLVGLGAVDVAVHRLPDSLTLPALPLTLGVVAGTAVTAPEVGSVLVGLVTAAVLGGLFWLGSALAPAAMGRGDVKLVPSLGLLTGFVSVPTAIVGLVAAFVLGALAALAGLAARRLTLRSAIPFGPFLLLGAWLAVTMPSLVTALSG